MRWLLLILPLFAFADVGPKEREQVQRFIATVHKDKDLKAHSTRKLKKYFKKFQSAHWKALKDFEQLHTKGFVVYQSSTNKKQYYITTSEEKKGHSHQTTYSLIKKKKGYELESFFGHQDLE